MVISPLMLRIRVARELNALLKPVGGKEITQTQLASMAGLSRQAIYRVLTPTSKENLERRCNATHVSQILDALGVEDERLVNMAVNASKSGPWSRLQMGPDQEVFADLAHGASEIREYQSHVVGGLVQTEDYARHRARVVEPDEAVVERYVRGRMRRQERLNDPDVTYTLLLEKLAIEREIAPRKVMIEQLEHLVKLSRQRNIHIHVLPGSPTTTGDDAPLAEGYVAPGPFVLYDYPDSTLKPEVAVIDSIVIRSDHILIDRDPVDLHAHLFGRLGPPVALSDAETVTYIQEVADRMKSAQTKARKGSLCPT